MSYTCTEEPLVNESVLLRQSWSKKLYLIPSLPSLLRLIIHLQVCCFLDHTNATEVHLTAAELNKRQSLQWTLFPTKVD